MTLEELKAMQASRRDVTETFNVAPIKASEVTT